MFFDNLQLAIQSISTNKLRSALTVIGVMIGVLSVVLIVSLGRTLEKEVSGSINALGADLVFVYPTRDLAGASRNTQLVERDAETIQSRIPGVQETAVLVSGQVRAVAGTSSVDTTLRGTDSSYFEISRLTVVEGSLFSRSDVRARANGVILGRTVANSLFGGMPAAGHRIKLNGVTTTVLGVAASPGAAASSDPNNFIVVPISTGRQRFGLGQGVPTSVGMILVEFGPSIDLAIAQQEIADLLRQTKRIPADITPPFGTSSTEDLAKTTSTLIKVVQLFLSAIASISIIVGGIGITNIMLVSVHERTREIGLRMAVGARPSDIRGQFLTESAVLCLLGGLTGVLFAVIVTGLITLATEFEVSISLGHVLSAFVLSITIGLVAGYAPARRAALLDPIEALRRD